MDIRKIKKLIEIIEESDIAKIEISEGVAIPIERNFSLISNPSFDVVLLPNSGGVEGCARRMERIAYVMTIR